MKLFFILIPILLIICCQTDPCHEEIDLRDVGRSKNKLEVNNIKSEIFQTELGWGYDLIINDKIYIHQSHIPAINSLKAFATAEDARKVANYAINKLLKTQKLPLLTHSELDSLNILN